MVNPGQELQDSHLACFSVRSQTPQELIACWITAGHLLIFQILQLHQILGDELLGLPKYEVPLPSIDIHLTQEIQDVFLCGAVALHENHTQEIHQETGLGKTPATVHDPVVGEIHLADKDIRMLGSVVFLHVNTKYHLHAVRSSFEDPEESILVLFIDDLQDICFLKGLFILYMHNRNCTNRPVCLVNECFPDRTLETGD